MSKLLCLLVVVATGCVRQQVSVHVDGNGTVDLAISGENFPCSDDCTFDIHDSEPFTFDTMPGGGFAFAPPVEVDGDVDSPALAEGLPSGDGRFGRGSVILSFTFQQVATSNIQLSVLGDGTIAPSIDGTAASCASGSCGFDGTTLSIVATAHPGAQFLGYTVDPPGALSGLTGLFDPAVATTPELAVSSDVTVTARFTPLITLVVDGPGSILSQGSPEGTLLCPPDCTRHATSLDLVASPTSESHFDTWISNTSTNPLLTGATPADAGVVAFDSNTTVTAMFLATCTASDSETAPPVLSSATPGNVCIGQTVTIDGTALGGTHGCLQLNQTPASIDASSMSSFVIAAIPAGTPTGELHVDLTTSQGTASMTFPGTTVVAATPITITGVAPSSGNPGDTVTISGTGLDGVNMYVALRPTSGSTLFPTITSTPSATSLAFTIPASAPTGVYTVSVGNDCVAEVIASQMLTVTAPTCTPGDTANDTAGPTLSSLNTDGPKICVGSIVFENGANLGDSMSCTTVNGGIAAIASNSGSQLITHVPASATLGPLSVSVTTMKGTVMFTDVNKQVIAGGPPTITTWGPTTVAAGGTLTFHGTNFDTAGTIVEMTSNSTGNQTTCAVLTATSTQLTCTAPSTPDTYTNVAIVNPCGFASAPGSLTVN